MQPGAHVNSIAALSEFRGALGIFGEEVDQTLSAIQAELQRFVNWLEHDQLAHWRQELRQREERLAEAKTDLHRCLSATIDPQRTPSCYQEKKIVEAAKRRLEEAEQKLAAVRRWIPVVRQAVFEYRLKIEPLESAVATELPRARASLESSLARLEAYLNMSPPGSAIPPSASATGTQTSTGTALPTEDATAPPAPPAPAADGAAPRDPGTAETSPTT